MTAADLGKPDVVLRGRFDRDHERRYAHVPFAVPPGRRQVHVRYGYNDRIDSDPAITGGNTLDIGLFDERGIARGSPGFRGWSGSNKLEFTIDESWATPPYGAGRIGAGTWHVLLGPYKVGPRGCDWTVEIWFDAGIADPRKAVEAKGTLVLAGPSADPLGSAAPTAPRAPLAFQPPARTGWLRGDLHCHTLYSDGDSSPQEMLAAAAEAGLEFLGVTDHNSVRHQFAYGPGGDGMPIVVPGTEVTTYGGHWNAWGTDRWWEFRQPEARAVEREMREAAASGAFVCVNHPKPLGPPWEYPDATGFHAVEIWNGPWERANSEALAFWEERLRRGERVVALGGSDTHYLTQRDPDPRHSPQLGLPTTWAEAGARPTAESILVALREGRSFISAAPDGPQVYLEADRGRSGRACVEVRAGDGATLLLVSESGTFASVPVMNSRFDTTVEAARGTRYLRAQLVGSNGDIVAITNPLWADRL